MVLFNNRFKIEDYSDCVTPTREVRQIEHRETIISEFDQIDYVNNQDS